MLNKVTEEIVKFRDERDWKQFHTGENLAKSIAIEASELLEVFQWSHEEKSIDKVKEELADVILYSLLMADHYGLDVEKICLDKIEVNKKKYPVELAKGKSDKYTEFNKEEESKCLG